MPHLAGSTSSTATRNAASTGRPCSPMSPTPHPPTPRRASGPSRILLSWRQPARPGLDLAARHQPRRYPAPPHRRQRGLAAHANHRRRRFLHRLAKSARKYWAGLTCITQDADDLLSTELGCAIIANSATQILLRQAPQAIDRVADPLRPQGRYRRGQGDRLRSDDSGTTAGAATHDPTV